MLLLASVASAAALAGRDDPTLEIDDLAADAEAGSEDDDDTDAALVTPGALITGSTPT